MIQRPNGSQTAILLRVPLIKRRGTFGSLIGRQPELLYPTVREDHSEILCRTIYRYFVDVLNIVMGVKAMSSTSMPRYRALISMEHS